jgi:very-short-patch-repair endonuclease
MTPSAKLKKEQAKAHREALEATLALHLKAERIAFVQQLKFWPYRLWRFDFAMPDHKLAIEVQGGTWSNGAHARGSGIENDTEKAAHAVIAGWRVIPVTGNQVKDGRAIGWIKQALGIA